MRIDRCWSCLQPLTTANAVALSSETFAPCCDRCWSEVPIAFKLELATKFISLSEVEARNGELIQALIGSQALIEEFRAFLRRLMTESEERQRVWDETHGRDDNELDDDEP